MPTELVLLMAFFVASFVTFALVMLVDTKVVVVRPPKLSFADGTAEANSADAEARHEEDKSNGTLRVRAAVQGGGRAEAVAELGHEFEIRAKKPGRYTIVAVCERATHLKVTSGAARLHLAMHLNIKDKSLPIGELTYSDIGERKIPPAGGLGPITKKEAVTLKPGQPCKVSVRVTATAEQTGAPEPVYCFIEIMVKVKELQLRPALANFLS